MTRKKKKIETCLLDMAENIVGFNILLIVLCLWIARPVFSYRTYYVEDECYSKKDVQKIIYNIPATGPNSVGEMRTNRFGTYSRTGRKCLIKLVPPIGYGVIITVKKVDFRNHQPCEDYIKVFTDEESRGQRLCGYTQNDTYGLSFYSNNVMKILYHTEDGGFGFNDGFRMIFTVAKRVDTDDECSLENQFKCANSRCIWVGATCDGYNNCGDASDESTTGSAQCPAITPITIAVISLAATTVVAILIAVCLCCCKVQQHQNQDKLKAPTDFPSRPNGGYIPLPGISYGNSSIAEQQLLAASAPLMQAPYHSAYTAVPIGCRTSQSPLDLPPPYRP